MFVPSIFKIASFSSSSSGASTPSKAPYQTSSATSNIPQDNDHPTSRFALCNGSPALIGMFRALARGNEDENGEEIGTEEESGIDEVISGMSTTEASPRQSEEIHQKKGKDRAGQDGGEWIGPIEITKPSEMIIGTTVGPAEKQVVIPSFYRTASSDQSDLSQRLAVLSVNNYTAEGRKGSEGRERKLSVTEEEGMKAVIKEKAEEIRKILKEDSAITVEEKLKADVEEKRRDLGAPLTILTDEVVTTSPADEEDETSLPSSGLEGIGVEPPLSDQDKLAAIQEEFGDIAGLMEGDEPERFVAESQGALFRGIIIVGVIHLTTHRMTFHAMMPPPHSIQNENGYTDGHTTVIHAGPVTIRRQHNIYGHKKSRVWMELTGEMCTTYPSADENGRVRPIRSVLLSTITRLYPLDVNRPCDIKFRYSTGEEEENYHFTVDTQESALEWHRQLEAAIFELSRARRYYILLAKRRKARQKAIHEGLPVDPVDIDLTLYDGQQNSGWEMLRVCLPLDRVVESGCEDYMQFARIINLDIDIVDPEGSTSDMLVCADEMENLYPSNPYPGQRPPRLKSTSTEVTSELPTPKRSNTLAARLGLSKNSKSKSKPSPDSSPAPSEDERGPIQRPKTVPVVARTHAMEEGHDDEPCYSGARMDGPAAPAAAAATPTPGALAEVHAEPAANGEKTITPRTISFRFAVLNQRAVFAQAFHKTLREVTLLKRKYKPGQRPPLPVIDIGKFSLFDLSEADGGNIDNGPISMKVHDEEAPKKKGVKAPFIGSMSSSLRPTKEADDGLSGSSDDEEVPVISKRRGLRDLEKKRKADAAKAVFGIRLDEQVWIKRCYVNRHIPCRGHLILSDRFLCFWRKTLSDDTDIRYRFSVHDIKGAVASRAFRISFKGMAIQIAGQQDLVFEFFSVKARDETILRINDLVARHIKDTHSSPNSSPSLQPRSSSYMSRTASLSSTPPTSPLSSTFSGATTLDSLNRQFGPTRKGTDLSKPTLDGIQPFDVPDEALAHLPMVVNRNVNTYRRPKARVFALLTIGSRGDVQPYIALALRLMNDGHKVVIVTHDEFKEWIEGYGIEHRQAGGDPGALMKLSVEHKILSPGFFKESLGHFREWLDDLLRDSWEACKDVDVIVESPSMMCGVHIAEALNVPYFRAFTMPWTRTSAYPQAFMVPAVEMGPGFNYSTYVLFDNIIWKATAPQINRWRKNLLHLKPTDMSQMSQTKIPMLYNFSSAVVPKPLDWHDDVTITGYWNLENSDTDWSPPDDLEAFMQKAVDDGKPLVYIGFGSIVVPHPEELTKHIIAAVQKADVRAIVAKGWSSRGQDPSKEGEEIVFPYECYSLEKVPHGWLFPRIDAALHHGGAGTVGASLRAGIPTLIKPWFGDQYFWAGRVTKLGVGLKVGSTSVDDIAAALSKATTDVVMRERAAKVGEKIRAEDGVGNAVKYIYSNLIRAGTDRRMLRWQK